MTSVLLYCLYEELPQLRGKVSYSDLGTSLSNNYYLGTQHGEVYGLEHTMKRFSADCFSLTSPYSPISGLYLSGAELASEAGIAAADERSERARDCMQQQQQQQCMLNVHHEVHSRTSMDSVM